MKNYFLLFLLVLNNSLLSQIEIELPKIDSKIEFSNNRTTILLDFHVKKNGQTFLKDSLINKEDIGNIVIYNRYKYQEFWKYNHYVSLSIDAKTPYKYVDFIKNQLNQSNANYYYYKTSNEKEMHQGFFYLIKTPTLYKKVIIKDSVVVKKYRYANYKETDLLHTFLDNLYSGNLKKSKSILNKMSYTKFEFLKNNQIRINDEKIVKSNSEEIKNELINSDICFSIYNPELEYNYYLKNLFEIKRATSKLKKENIRYAYFFEVSMEISPILKTKIKI